MNESGFKKGHRTDDKHFVLQTVYQKYVTLAHKKVYLEFVESALLYRKH